MPVVRFDVRTLQTQLDGDASRDELREQIPRLGADVEETGGDEWAVEFFPDRPDLFTVEGIARALRHYRDPSTAPAEYDVEDAQVTLEVDDSVDPVRPVIAGAVLRGVRLPPGRLEGLIELQEDLHWGLGSRRRKVAIGIHDMASIEPPFTYRAVEPEAVSFVPLESEPEMDLGQILAKHPKGQDYAHILEGADRYPVIEDADGDVLSFPPVINAQATEVTSTSQTLFVDVTGTDRWSVGKALNVVVTSLAEAGATVEAVDLVGGEWDRTPDLSPEAWSLDVGEAHRLLGTDLDAGETAHRLRRMGHAAEPAGEDRVSVAVPSYRVDVLHDVDLVEDVAIGHGYDAVAREDPDEVTYGQPRPVRQVAGTVRDSLTGLGFLEAMTLNLSNDGDQFHRLGFDEAEAVRVRNPVSEDHEILRVRILPGLLDVLAHNTHRDLPQRIFEVGVVTPPGDRPQPVHRVAGAEVAAEVGFSDVKGWVQALARDLDWDLEVEAADHPAYVDGRCARARLDGEDRGVFGEVHPRTVTAFELDHPVGAFELDLPTPT
jgi:phenylalanyl-tRNA synthetase beta chain